MNKNNEHLFEDGPEDPNEYPLIVRISAKRAIARAQLEAKIIRKAFKSKYIFVCRLPSYAVSPNLRIEDLRCSYKNHSS